MYCITGVKNTILTILIRSLPIFSVSVLLFTCSKSNKIDTVQKLADALKKQGIKFQAIEEGETKLPKVDEIIVLTGDSLRVEILRIEDETALKTAVFALKLRLKFDKDKELDEDKLQDIFNKKPFVVMIYQEPETGIVNRALNKIFPSIKEKTVK